MKYLSRLFLVATLASNESIAALTKSDLITAEALWIKSQGIEVADKDIQVKTYPSSFNIQFEPDYSTTLLERGDLSVDRKILMNAGGTEINPTVFQFDLHLELSYKFI